MRIKNESKQEKSKKSIKYKNKVIKSKEIKLKIK